MEALDWRVSFAIRDVTVALFVLVGLLRREANASLPSSSVEGSRSLAS